MNIRTKHYGTHGFTMPSAIIEIIIEGYNSSITEDITDLKGKVDDGFISQLRNIADELEDQNNKLKGGNDG